MISGARQYSQRDFALSLTKARIALVTNASRQAGLPHSLSRIDVCGSPPCLRLYRPYVAGTQPAFAHCAKGPVFLAINNRAVYAATLSLGDQAHNSNEPGLLWSLVEEW